MKRFESGCQKRKKKHELAMQLKKLPKVDNYFVASGKQFEPQEQAAEQTRQDEPSTSRANTVFKAETNADSEVEKPSRLDISNVECADIVKVSEEVAVLEDLEVTGNILETEKCDEYTKANDIGLWSVPLSKDEISIIIREGPEHYQHRTGPFTNSRQIFQNKSIRYCSAGLFLGTKVNGEKYDREWLTYSPTTGRLYCFYCKVLSSSSVKFANVGFNDWRYPISIQKHENSEEHRQILLRYLSRRRDLHLNTNFEIFDKQIQIGKKYWRQVIERLIAVICTLAERGLAFRGDVERFGSLHNGNYLGLLELVAKFDPFLANHIEQHGNKGTGKPSYLSKTVCDELIHLMAVKVRSSILKDLKKAGYYSISVDSTPDLSHVDQLTVIVRHVSPEDGFPIERFLAFLQLNDHSGKNIANVVLNYLENICEIDFSKCRGQSYDNAANMSGRYNGMQQILLEKNKFAKYIPCSGHSLNLVGRAAVDCCLDAVNFFNIIQQVYTFFSASTKRWNVLKSYLASDSTVVKRLCDTRWEAHAKAVSAVSDGYESIIDALYCLHENESEKGDTRREAGLLQEKMEELEFSFMLEFWYRILDQFHKTNKALQDSKLTLDTCAKLYSSLLEFLKSNRNSFDEIEAKAKKRLPDVDYKAKNQRQRRRKQTVDDGNAPNVDEHLTSRDKFRINSFIPMLDMLGTNLQKRALIYQNFANNFSFLVDLDATDSQLHDHVMCLMEEYPEDVDISLLGELKHFHIYVKTHHTANERNLNHQALYQIIFQDKLNLAFPNVEATLRLFLSLMVTNCSGERSFSQLKRLKNELRTTMLQERLSDLAILCIEAEKLRTLSFEDIIDDFAELKSRKKTLQ